MFTTVWVSGGALRGDFQGPGLDRTAACSPRAVKARDGCPWAGRRALKGEFGVGGNGRWQGTAKGSKERQGTVEDCGGWLVNVLMCVFAGTRKEV